MDEEKKETPRETNNDNNKSLAMTTPSSQSLPLLMVSAILCSSLSVDGKIENFTSTPHLNRAKGQHSLFMSVFSSYSNSPLCAVRLVDIKFIIPLHPSSHIYENLCLSKRSSN